jgi:hypothetical protein
MGLRPTFELARGVRDFTVQHRVKGKVMGSPGIVFFREGHKGLCCAVGTVLRCEEPRGLHCRNGSSIAGPSSGEPPTAPDLRNAAHATA